MNKSLKFENDLILSDWGASVNYILVCQFMFFYEMIFYYVFWIYF